MHDQASSASETDIDAVFVFRYRERFHLSWTAMENEPFEALAQARAIWSLDHERDKLEEERAKPA